MFTLKGFASSNAFIDNTPGVVSSIGELSPQSLTFSLEKGYYKNNSYNDLTLVSFSIKDNGVSRALTLAESNAVIDVINYTYTQTLSQPTVAIDPATLINNLSVQYQGTYQNFKCGSIESNGTYYVPQWVEYQIVADNSLVHLWFTDAAFSTQYDEYALKFVPALDNLDDFFLPGYQVEQKIKAVTSIQLVEKIQTLKGNDPETYIDLKSYNYIDPADATHIVPTLWGVVGYGPVSSNIDVVKAELIAYILAHSTHTREEWTAILPDIFKSTEFILAPYWKNYAIAPRQTTPGIYSAFVAPAGSGARLKGLLPTYTQNQIDTYSLIFDFPFKGLQIASVGSIENRDNKFSLTDYFPDFISVSSTSEDFNRMVQYTRDWSIMVHELIVDAEEATPNTLLPLYISKITRDNIFYLSRVYDNVQYLVATKYSTANL